MKQLTKIFAISIFASFISISLAQEKPKMKEHKIEMNKVDKQSMNMDSSKTGHKNMDMKDHKNMEMDSSKTMDESIIRKGEIDLQAIDENKDGKVYQDVMDFNVISDKPGKCPLCGMKLKEVSLEKAKETLLKNDFEVKGK